MAVPHSLDDHVHGGVQAGLGFRVLHMAGWYLQGFKKGLRGFRV